MHPIERRALAKDLEISRLLKGGTEAALAVRPCPRLTDAVIATTDTDLLDRKSVV